MWLPVVREITSVTWWQQLAVNIGSTGRMWQWGAMKETGFGVAWLRQSASWWIAHHWTGIEASITSPPSTASCCRHVTLVISMTNGSHVTTRKLQFAEEGPTLRVQSYELSKTLRWCERLINCVKFIVLYSCYSLCITVILYNQFIVHIGKVYLPSFIKAPLFVWQHFIYRWFNNQSQWCQ